MEKRVPIHPATETDLPDGLWMQIDQLLIFDQVKRKIWAISYADLRDPTVDLQQAYKEAKSRVTALISKLQSPLDSKNTVLDWTPPQSSSQPLEYTSNISEADFCANVQTAKDYIKAGDIFQVVLSQQLKAQYTGGRVRLRIRRQAHAHPWGRPA